MITEKEEQIPNSQIVTKTEHTTFKIIETISENTESISETASFEEK